MFPLLRKDDSKLRRPNFLALLTSLVLMLVVVPLIENRFVALILRETFLTAVFLTAVVANRDRRRLATVGACIGAFAIALSWATVRINHPALNITSYVSTAVFLATMAGMILVSVLYDHVASMRAIFGAICVYLLIGLCWAMMYSALEYMQSDAFALAHRTMPVRLRDGREITSYSQMVYFSFVTMTSLGYGDITPRTPAAQTLTWLQAVAGQLYITVLIARLVSALPQTIPKRDAE